MLKNVYSLRPRLKKLTIFIIVSIFSYNDLYLKWLLPCQETCVIDLNILSISLEVNQHVDHVGALSSWKHRISFCIYNHRWMSLNLRMFVL